MSKQSGRSEGLLRLMLQGGHKSAQWRGEGSRPRGVTAVHIRSPTSPHPTSIIGELKQKCSQNRGGSLFFLTFLKRSPARTTKKEV